ncbi:unnamed protein product, partial [Scytosiphon promiscuus]
MGIDRVGGSGRRRRSGSLVGGGGRGGGEGTDHPTKELQEAKTLVATCVVLRVSPAPAPGLPPLLELPTLRCTIVVAWHTLGGPSPDHWVYLRPRNTSSAAVRADQRPSGASSEAAITTATTQQQRRRGASTMAGTATAPAQEGEKDEEPLESPASIAEGGAGVFVPGVGAEGVRATLPNRPIGATLPPLPPGMELPDSLAADLCALPPRMSVSAFGCCLGWAVEWGACFSKLPPVGASRECRPPFSPAEPKRATMPPPPCGPRLAPPPAQMGRKRTSSDASVFARLRREAEGSLSPAAMVMAGRGEVDGGEGGGGQARLGQPVRDSFADLVRGFRLGPVFLSEVDASAYTTAPADISKRGIRVSIRGGVATSLCFSVEKSGAINPFATGRVVIPTTSLVVTTVHGLRLRAGKIEARLCDRNAGSRGSLLLRLRRVALAQGSGDVAPRIPSPKGGNGSNRRAQHAEGRRSRFHSGGRPARSATSIWASRGGVPPRLELLPSHSRSRDSVVLASLGESSAEEGDGDVGRSGGRLAEPKRKSASSPGAEAAGEAAGDVEDTVAHRQVGSGGWDDHLRAITRAAWLGSKQASSSRGFNSNTSSVSAGSASATPTSIMAAASAAASNGAAVGTDSQLNTPFNSNPFSSTGSRGFSADRRRGEGAAEPDGTLPPTSLLPPRPPSPKRSATANTATADLTAAGTPGTSSTLPPEACVESDGSSASEAGIGDRPARDIAGSGFLYRVVFDGLNVLITLRLRDSLVLLVQSGIDVALATLPGLSKPSNALLAKEREGEVLLGDRHRRSSLDLKQFIDKPLALPGRRRDSGSLTPYSRADGSSRQSEDSVDSRSTPNRVTGDALLPTISEGSELMTLTPILATRRWQRPINSQLLGSETARATLLFSMEQGVIQGWVGLDPVEEGTVAARLKQGDVVESCRLQCLAQRLLTTFREAVTVGLEGTMLSAAPTGRSMTAS